MAYDGSVSSANDEVVGTESIIENVARYEALLSRKLYSAPHEPEALQNKRAGGTAPLARLDVQGVEG